MPFDADAASKHIESSALAGSSGRCATYVRAALVAGGLDTSGNPVSAKSYGPFLKGKGFSLVEVKDLDKFQPQKGDIAVIQDYEGGSPHGHIAMWSGSAWYSDFKQRDVWGGPGYRKAKPGLEVYRYIPVVAEGVKP